MKKINKIAALLSLPFLMLLSSCMDPIFYELRKDVKPETATVSGNISTVTRFTEDGYCFRKYFDSYPLYRRWH